MYTVLSGWTCLSLGAYSFLHISNVSILGTQTLTIALEQHNAQCTSAVAPYPETWGGVDLRRYLQPSGDVWVPLAHFRINLQRVAALAFRALFEASVVSMGTIEFTAAQPEPNIRIALPAMAPQSRLHFHCSRPDVISLAIDDGM